MKLLHLDSSIQGDGSVSRQLSAAVVARLRAADPTLEVVARDLAADPLPHVTLARLGTAEAQAVLEEFLAADIVVIGAPMYNFGVPTQLKAWFDHILIAGRTFRYGAEGPEGLAGGKRVIVAHSRGGLYGSDTAMAAVEHAESHLRGLLGFIGIAPEFLIAEGIALGPEHREKAVHEALRQTEALTASPLVANT